MVLASKPALRTLKVLLTGFNAFGGEAINPSWLAVQALQGKQIHRHRVVAAQLPTEFAASLAALNALLSAHQPALVICTGVAAGRMALSLERIAINIIDARIADNAGQQPVDTPVVPGGPAAYFSTLPIKAMLQNIQAAGESAEVSQSAGTFVCNHVFYGLMHTLATQRRYRPARGGFIHVPALADMPLEQMVLGLRTAIRAALTHTQDVAVGAGAVA